MQLEFVPVEDFYFALTLCCRTLEDIGDREDARALKAELAEKFGQSSTVAAAKQNSFNYTFQVSGVDNSPSPQLVISIADWQDQIRISSDYGWTLNENRKPTRTEKFDHRNNFAQELKEFLRQEFHLSIPQ